MTISGKSFSILTLASEKKTFKVSYMGAYGRPPGKSAH